MSCSVNVAQAVIQLDFDAPGQEAVTIEQPDEGRDMAE